jgi:selenocysteine-specific elongation factor
MSEKSPAAPDRGGPAEPLTIGTAGHVDHGKTALVAALTGVDTDRLAQEKARGLTIELGYAPLPLPCGRRLSLIDVPGHERFVRTMVAGATGVDVFLMVVAADDGVMPQTREHAAVLRALAVERGVVAVTKCDVAAPARARAEVAELLGDVPVVACSARSGEGLGALLAAIESVVQAQPSRAAAGGPARLHIDRVFTVPGRGTVVTGTLWSGEIASGEQLVPRGCTSTACSRFPAAARSSPARCGRERSPAANSSSCCPRGGLCGYAACTCTARRERARRRASAWR